jgi:CPA2 family monovalent cation:H+ antiporter-2
LLTAALAPGESGESQPWWLGAGAVVGVLVIGFYLINPFLRLISKYGSNEVMTAAALFIVLLTAVTMYKVGLSMGMGAFIAGILLADSSFKHQLETEIEPFKGLLLGLFFIAIGMNLNLDLLIQDPIFVVGAAVALMLVKALVIATIIRFSGESWTDSNRVAIMLSQGGEFAFVVMTLAVSSLLLEPNVAGMVNLVVGVSMALTSPAVILYSMWFNSRNCPSVMESNIQNEEPNVVIAGFGRFGQITARILAANNIHFTAIDIDATHIEFVKKFGNKVFYGDATRLDLLKKSGIETCDVLLVAIDKKEACTKLSALVKEQFPHVKLVVRARDRVHATELAKLGIEAFVRETFHSGLVAACNVLKLVGYSEETAHRMADAFSQHDYEQLDKAINEEMDIDDLIRHSAQGREALRDLFQEDKT